MANKNKQEILKNNNYLRYRRYGSGYKVYNALLVLYEIYDITQTELVENIVAMNTDPATGDSLYDKKTIENYIRVKTPMPVSVLMDIANYFSTHPDPDGQYHYISLDYLMGRTDDFTTVVSEDYLKTGNKDRDKILDTLQSVHRNFFKEFEGDYLKKNLGLEKEAIETLKTFNLSDNTLVADSTHKHLDWLYANVTPSFTMNVLNFFLEKGDAFRRLLMAFYLYSRPDIFKYPVVGRDKEYELIGDKKVCLAHSQSRLDDNIPIEIDTMSLRAIKRKEIDLLIEQLSTDYAEEVNRLGN
ncbi:MAG: hypothetical protein K6G10_01020 [Butyrivibrio sp.]|nr:hypothetical protein [Butyrivibrio sp.]